jgi:hypothetical protein
MLNILAEREFPVDEIAALASRRSLGTEVSFGDKTSRPRISTVRLHRLGHRALRHRVGSDEEIRARPPRPAAW